MNLCTSTRLLKVMVMALAIPIHALSYGQAVVQPKPQSPSVVLKNYALSVCLQHASDDPSFANDARATAAAYVELGEVNDSDAYLIINRMAKEWLKKEYASKAGASLSVMKCIDFFHSKQLAQKLTQYTKGIPKR